MSEEEKTVGSEFVIAEDVAQDEFDRFCKEYELDIDPAGMDDEDKKSFREARRVITQAVMRGRLSFESGGHITQTLRDGKVLRWEPPKGDALLAMDQKKKNADMGKMYAAAAVMVKKPPAIFATMDQRDVKVVMTLVGLFLA